MKSKEEQKKKVMAPVMAVVPLPISETKTNDITVGNINVSSCESLEHTKRVFFEVMDKVELKRVGYIG